MIDLMFLNDDKTVNRLTLLGFFMTAFGLGGIIL